jgi:hypothetical protein
MTNSNKCVFESPRDFIVVSYSAGHGLLLVRSRKTTANPTRLDVLLQDVRAMEIRCWFSGMRIEEVGPEYLDRYGSKPAELIEPGNRVYALFGTDWSGFVVGGIVSVHEDTGDDTGPSPLIETTGSYGELR